MRRLSDREKNLGVVVLAVVLLFSVSRIKQRHRAREAEIQGRLRQVQGQLEQSRALLSAPIEEPQDRPAPSNETTMKFLADITLPTEVAELKIVSADHPTPAEYRLVVEGRFSGMMRFLSYLERADSAFKVNHVDLARVPEPQPTGGEPMEPQRRVKGTFHMTRRSG